jgi:RNase H-like domain found in reverse transcriptase
MSNKEIRKICEEKNDLSKLKTFECVGPFWRVLKPAETGYFTIKREFLLIVDSLKFFTNQIRMSRHPVGIFTDHSNLSKWTSFTATRYRHYSWIEAMSGYNSIFLYINTERNTLADALSRPNNAHMECREHPRLLDAAGNQQTLEKTEEESVEKLIRRAHNDLNCFHTGVKNTQKVLENMLKQKVARKKIERIVGTCIT